MNCLPFLGHGNRSPRDGGLSMSIGLRCRHDRSVRGWPPGCSARAGVQIRRRKSGHPCRSRAKMAADVPGRGKGRAAEHGQARSDATSRPRSPQRGRGRRQGWPSRAMEPSLASATPLKQWCRLYRGGRGRGPEAGPRKAQGSGAKAAPMTPRAGARARGQEARGAGGVPKKIDGPEGGAALPNREKA